MTSTRFSGHLCPSSVESVPSGNLLLFVASQYFIQHGLITVSLFSHVTGFL